MVKFSVEKLVHMQRYLKVLFSSAFLVVEYPHISSEVCVTLVGKGSSANTALESSLIFLYVYSVSELAALTCVEQNSK